MPVAKEVFDQHMPAAEPVRHASAPDVNVTRQATCSTSSPRRRSPRRACATTSSVGIQYLGAWLAGNGCVPVFNLMEDAATAEISRSQIWQWIRSPKGVLDDGRKVTPSLFKKLLAEELRR